MGDDDDPGGVLSVGIYWNTCYKCPNIPNGMMWPVFKAH